MLPLPLPTQSNKSEGLKGGFFLHRPWVILVKDKRIEVQYIGVFYRNLGICTSRENRSNRMCPQNRLTDGKLFPKNKLPLR